MGCPLESRSAISSQRAQQPILFLYLRTNQHLTTLRWQWLRTVWCYRLDLQDSIFASFPTQLRLNYDSKEHIGAAYAMVTVKSEIGEINAGFRAEHTNQIYTMLQKFRNMGQVGEESYWDYLPSASIKWMPTEKMNVRLSYYRSINRPGFYEIVPYQIMGEEYMEKGNPDLKRAKIDNIDLRWEWFPSKTEHLGRCLL